MDVQETLYKLTPVEFEQLACQLLIANGLKNVTYVGGPLDQGVDITAEDNGKVVAVQVKHKQNPLSFAELSLIVKKIKASSYQPHRLVIITSAQLKDSVKDSIVKSEPNFLIQIIDRDEVVNFLNAETNLRKGPLVAAQKRSQQQRMELIVGVLGASVSIMALVVTLFAVPSKPPLYQRIETVEKAIDNLKNLEKELVDIKRDMAATEQAARAIKEEYHQAKELEKLTDTQFEAIKSALQRESWQKTLLNYFLGFLLGVAGSLTASVIYTRLVQKRALSDNNDT
jgi:hypothetical protein